MITQLLFCYAVSCGAIGASIGYCRYYSASKQGNLHVTANGALSGMQAVLTVGAVAEAALAALFVAMAHDAEGFARSNLKLARLVQELYWENVVECEVALDERIEHPNANNN